MGITISHTNYAPLSLVSTILGFISFTFTLLTLLKVFWSNLGTFRAAPEEIPDMLSGLKQGLLEERRHLRRVRRRLKSFRRDSRHGNGGGARSGGSDREGGGGGYGYGGYDGGRRKSIGRDDRRHHQGKKHQMYFERDIQSMESSAEDEAIRTIRQVLKNLIKRFRALEQPFLKDEFKGQDSAHWSTSTGPIPYGQQEKRGPRHHSPSPYGGNGGQHSDDDSPAAQHLYSTDHYGDEYRTTGFQERWLWVKRKNAFISLNTILSRVEVRRTAHEVGQVLNVVCNVGRDIEDLRDSLDGIEGRLNRVVGVRRVD